MGTELSVTGAKQTILRVAVALGIPLLTAEETDKQILDLLQQVGDLECANAMQAQTNVILQTEVERLKERNAALEDGIEAISALCSWRDLGFCDLKCKGRAFCRVGGLQALPLTRETGEAGKP